MYVNGAFTNLFAYYRTSLMYANNPFFHLFADCKGKTTFLKLYNAFCVIG